MSIESIYIAEPEPQPKLGRHTNQLVSSQEQNNNTVYYDADGIYRAQVLLHEERAERYARLSNEERYDASDSVSLAMARRAVALGMIHFHEQEEYREEVPLIMARTPVWFEPHSHGMARGIWEEDVARMDRFEIDASTESERAILLAGVAALSKYLAK